MTPGRPSSSSSTSPGSAAARLEVSPDDAGDPAGERLRHDGLLGVGGHVGRADPREPELGDAARLRAAVSRTRPPCGPPWSASVDGCAAESTPDGDTASFTTAIAALIVP